MFEDKRTCPSCGRLIDWGERSLFCSDNRMICYNCLRIANLPEPPIKESGKVQPFPSSFFLNRIQAHICYDEFCNKEGTKILLDGQLLINETDHTFAVGCNDYDEMLIGFQSGSYDSIDSISINDGVQTKSVQISEGDSGAAGALFGGLVFGPLGAIVGGLGTRENAKYDEIKQTDNIGFTITHNNTSHDVFNVLKLCMNYDFVNYESQRDIYEQAKAITVKICEELLKCVDKIRPKSPTQSAQPQTYSSPTTSSININPSNLEPTITRIELFLEDKEWETVKAYANAALDYFPTDYRLYLFLLFADLKVSEFDELAESKTPFGDNTNYKRAVRFADSDTSEKLKACAVKAEALQNEEAQKNSFDSIENTIIEEDPDFEAVTCDIFSVYLPKHFTQKVMNIAGSVNAFGPENDSILLMLSRKDTLQDSNFPRGPFITEENVTNDIGTFHMASWKDLDTPSMIWAEYYCKMTECNQGLCVRAMYSSSSGIDFYDKIKKGVLNIKIDEKAKNALGRFDELIERRRTLLASGSEQSNLTEIIDIEKELLETAGIKQTNNVYRFSPFNGAYSQIDGKPVFCGINEWMIVGRNEDEVLLVSKYSEKDKIAYSREKVCTWEKSIPNLYLNYVQNIATIKVEPFYKSFSSKQLSLFGKLILLSKEEVEHFLPNQEDRILYSKSSMTAVPWILRDDVTNNEVTIVTTNGSFAKEKNYISMWKGCYGAALRPALWIDLSMIKTLI